MKRQRFVLLTILVLLWPFYASSSDFEDASTPIEQDDVKTIGQINDGYSFEEESTPIEREDKKAIDQVDDQRTFENASTPIEQEDIKTIKQLND